MSLKYEQASEPLHIYVNWLFLNRGSSVFEEIEFVQEDQRVSRSRRRPKSERKRERMRERVFKRESFHERVFKRER